MPAYFSFGPWADEQFSGSRLPLVTARKQIVSAKVVVRVAIRLKCRGCSEYGIAPECRVFDPARYAAVSVGTPIDRVVEVVSDCRCAGQRISDRVKELIELLGSPRDDEKSTNAAIKCLGKYCGCVDRPLSIS